MNYFRRGISIAVLIAMLVQLSSYAGETANRSSIISRCFNLVKMTSKVASGIGLALAAHIATELPIVLSHEYGHYIANCLTGGSGGKIHLSCHLDETFGVFMPFSGAISVGSGGNELVTNVSGPLAGIGVNYAIMAGINSMHTARHSSSRKECVKAGLTSPLRAYKDVSNEVARVIVDQRKYQTPSFSKIFMMTFNLLKTSKIFGEFLYGLTPISIEGGDGQKIWQELGLAKNMTVNEMTGFWLATIPTVFAITFGIAKGVRLHLKNTEVIQE